MSNDGNVHEILKDYSLKVKGKGLEKNLPFSSLKGVFGENVLAKHSRNFKITLPKELIGQESLTLDLVKQ